MEDPAELIDYARRESHVVWKAVEAFIRRENDEGRNVLVEGVAVLPELMSQLENIPHRVVYIGHQGENLQKNINKSAEENEHDWMRDVSGQYIGAFTMFVRQMSAFIEQEAKKYGFENIEMDKVLFGDVTEEVKKSLGLSARKSLQASDANMTSPSKVCSRRNQREAYGLCQRTGKGLRDL